MDVATGLIAGLVLLCLNLLLLVWLALRPRGDPAAEARAQADQADQALRLAGLQQLTERLDRDLRDELGRSAQGTRLELGQT
ncbi:MAG: hypothetical protein JNM26_14710, partial [Ideonella sp.]|nr:hypothetical protein [Ideonella sp.]